RIGANHVAHPVVEPAEAVGGVGRQVALVERPFVMRLHCGRCGRGLLGGGRDRESGEEDGKQDAAYHRPLSGGSTVNGQWAGSPHRVAPPPLAAEFEQHFTATRNTYRREALVSPTGAKESPNGIAPARCLRPDRIAGPCRHVACRAPAPPPAPAQGTQDLLLLTRSRRRSGAISSASARCAAWRGALTCRTPLRGRHPR